MRIKILAALFLLFATCCSAQVYDYLEVLNPPLAGQPGYDDLFSTILKQPTVNGLAVFLQWSLIDTNSGPCDEATTCSWGNIDTQLLAYIQGTGAGPGISKYGQTLNLIISIIPETNKPGYANHIPAYVFQPPYASWCPNCNDKYPQDLATCSDWPGDASAPTCNPGAPNPTPTACATPQPGIWNVNAGACHITGSAQSCPGLDNADFSGYPVLYETPLMTAWQKFVDTVLKHYSPSGSGSGPAIGQYISYVRVGLANGGENLPECTQAVINKKTTGIWPSPQGLSYDIANGVAPDWYATTAQCPGGSNDELACRGKYAYISGSPNGAQVDGTGYVATMFPAFYGSLINWFGNNTHVHLMLNAHSGPPSSADISYADQEAAILCCPPIHVPPQPGFGQESLSEYDLNYPLRACTDDWCNLFSSEGGFHYLQTTIPNNAATYSINNISVAAPYTNGLVTCNGSCTNTTGFPTAPGATLGGLYAGEGFALALGVGPKKTTYKIAQQGTNTGIISANSFTCDSNTPCSKQTGGTVYVGDYLPDTIPFASANGTYTFEIYFCDWEFAFNKQSGGSNCQAYDPVNSPLYAGVLNSY